MLGLLLAVLSPDLVPRRLQAPTAIRETRASGADKLCKQVSCLYLIKLR